MNFYGNPDDMDKLRKEYNFIEIWINALNQYYKDAK
jgi:hypothetical protein